MWQVFLAATTLILVGCAQLPPTSEDIQAKKFEAVPGKAVIYIVRSKVDSPNQDTLALDEVTTITTQPGSYYRWEVMPGLHRIAGFAHAGGLLVLQAEAGKIYFVQHSVFGTIRDGPQVGFVQQLSEREGRALVSQAVLL